ncbi:hypothetical protein GHT07_07340 [Caenimonas koreensis DSM 17982]|uniref:Tetratricopeptide repeat-containing protein n=1 Tax=Caenimonas koreensis DSM 17982 TaxID=1121255 RepID=A0A844B6F5_9BURK|nr:tetratricopeptide repeat protein [Caenimonas koreensis]MRD47087.1 hypothetical protein [Caenimonas koreensis DSM 17982]
MTANEDPGTTASSGLKAPSAHATAQAAQQAQAAQALALSARLTDAQVNTLYRQVYNMTEQGRFDEANVLLALIMMYRPDEPKFSLASAICFRKTGCFEDAIRMFARTLELQPDNDEPAFEIVECMSLLGLHDNATDLLRQIADVARRENKTHTMERAETLLEFKKATVQ